MADVRWKFSNLSDKDVVITNKMGDWVVLKSRTFIIPEIYPWDTTKLDDLRFRYAGKKREFCFNELVICKEIKD